MTADAGGAARRAAASEGPADAPEDDAARTASRKRDHLEQAVLPTAVSTIATGLDDWQVRARALPGRDLDEVALDLPLWGRRLQAPLLVSCMTGGVSEAGPVNRALAAAAAEHGIALGLGSGRVLLEDPTRTAGFQVRDVAPDVLLLANIGAAQLSRYGAEGCRTLVEACQADGLVVHLNAVQEAVQPGGDTDLGSVLADLTAVCATLDAPVVVKEVGFGLGPDDVGELLRAGVSAVDVAGAGGTNWARIEGGRDPDAGAVAAAFTDWGWPTAVAVAEARAVLDAAPSPATLIGSGGVRHGVDALKVLCLGADLVGVGRGLLSAAAEGPSAATRAVGVLVRQLQVATWAAGAGTLAELGPHRLRRR